MKTREPREGEEGKGKEKLKGRDKQQVTLPLPLDPLSFLFFPLSFA
jgi:hypothetical protein